jgi:phosphonate transport system substrate-binding protein
MHKSYINMLILALSLQLIIAGCSTASEEAKKTFIISANPNQDAGVLQQLFSKVADYLEQELNIPVEYQASATYDTTVDLFRVGKLDMVWFGGLTGVQARLRTDGSQAIAQRNIDPDFQSVFIANVNTGLKPFDSLEDLTQLEGHSFTFGSQSSTSGRLMPSYFFGQAGVDEGSFNGPVNFSGSHDATIDLVTSGQYEAGVVSIQIWESRVESGEVDFDKVIVLWQSPAFYDNHWLIHPQAAKRYGDDFVEQVQTALFNLESSVPQDAEILAGFGAEKFIATQNENYLALETVARQLGLIND